MKKNAIGKTTSFLDDVNDAIHPETRHEIIRILRNHLFAEKADTVARKLALEIQNRKPEITITVGSNHYGIEKAFFKKDEERARLINEILSSSGSKGMREKIATIARFDYNKKENKWEMTDRFKDKLLAGIEK